eukprot:scaffold60711_cov65-Attheya_sp.AAC.4
MTKKNDKASVEAEASASSAASNAPEEKTDESDDEDNDDIWVPDSAALPKDLRKSQRQVMTPGIEPGTTGASHEVNTNYTTGVPGLDLNIDDEIDNMHGGNDCNK